MGENFGRPPRSRLLSSTILRLYKSGPNFFKKNSRPTPQHTTEQTNRSIFVLTIVTVLALPINIVTGLLGMNVGGIPMADAPYGFWIVLGIIFNITFVAVWWVCRSQRD